MIVHFCYYLIKLRLFVFYLGFVEGVLQLHGSYNASLVLIDLLKHFSQLLDVSIVWHHLHQDVESNLLKGRYALEFAQLVQDVGVKLIFFAALLDILELDEPGVL